MYQYPFQSNFLNIEGKKYHYLDEGAGSPIVMVHGNPSWSYYYRNLVCELRKSHRCIVPDHIGCGFSDKPQDYQYTLENHISNLERLIEHLQLKNITLIMHDWGGAIGMGYATRHPKNISKLVILNTAAFIINHLPLRIRICRIPMFGEIAVRGFNAFALGATYMACKSMSQKTRKTYITPYDNYKNRIATLKFIHDIPFSPKHPTWKTIKEIESKLALFKDTEKIIFWGKKDFCFDDVFLKKWKEIYPNAEIIEFKDAGHYVLEDAGDEILTKLKSL
ncbi:MAG: alpha/beta fold hydrolase [Verrucomicrobiota bacterium]|nr:alpha/beta fold hydrolase [Verrucomicrobiota bacterium]